MKITKIIQLSLALFSICLIPFSLNGIDKYSVFVNQPNQIRPPVIEWVTVSENSKNQIDWIKQVNDNIVYYNVYRNSTDLDTNWVLAGVVNYNSDDYLNDLNSYATIQSYRYRISAVDKCGNETFSNSIFRTIFLQIKPPINGSNILDWNPYEGINVTSYRIYKGTTPFNLAVIDSVSSDLTTYTDQNVNLTNNYYQVEALGYELDSISNHSIKANFARAISNQIHSFSNIITHNFDTILNSLEIDSLQIFPNPLETESVVKFPYYPSQHYKLYIYDLIGNIISERSLTSGEFLIHRQDFNNGLYILKVSGKKSIQIKLIVGGHK
jgi:hypothetical protein